MSSYAEIIGPEGQIHYRRPVNDPMVEEARKIQGYSVRIVEPFAHFDDMTWPSTGEYWKDLEWRLRYSNPTRQDMISAASVLSAYRQMIYDPIRKRQRVISEIRKVGAP